MGRMEKAGYEFHALIFDLHAHHDPNALESLSPVSLSELSPQFSMGPMSHALPDDLHDLHDLQPA